MELDCDFMIHCGLPDNHLFMYEEAEGTTLIFEKTVEYYRGTWQGDRREAWFGKGVFPRFLESDLGPRDPFLERVKGLNPGGNFTGVLSGPKKVSSPLGAPRGLFFGGGLEDIFPPFGEPRTRGRPPFVKKHLRGGYITGK